MGGGGVEGSSGLREAKALGRGERGREALYATPLYILPQGYTPHLDLASFIFKSQTFLGRRKQVGSGAHAETLSCYPGSSQLSLSLCQTSQFVNSVHRSYFSAEHHSSPERMATSQISFLFYRE